MTIFGYIFVKQQVVNKLYADLWEAKKNLISAEKKMNDLANQPIDKDITHGPAPVVAKKTATKRVAKKPKKD